jgi:hypothetical protein
MLLINFQAAPLLATTAPRAQLAIDCIYSILSMSNQLLYVANLLEESNWGNGTEFLVDRGGTEC